MRLRKKTVIVFAQNRRHSRYVWPYLVVDYSTLLCSQKTTDMKSLIAIIAIIVLGSLPAPVVAGLGVSLFLILHSNSKRELTIDRQICGTWYQHCYVHDGRICTCSLRKVRRSCTTQYRASTECNTHLATVYSRRQPLRFGVFQLLANL